MMPPKCLTLLVMAAFFVGETMSHTSPRIDLSKCEWVVQNSNRSITTSARVPGGIYSDLMRNNIIDDILKGSNDVTSRWVAYENWTFHTNFEVSDIQMKSIAVHLVFLGLDTVATIRLNGAVLGHVDNMFLEHRIDATRYIKEGANQLTLAFESPVLVGQERWSRTRVLPVCVPDEYHGECHANQIRKMQSSFAWDWGPAFPSVGIWKPAYVEFVVENASCGVVQYVRTEIVKREQKWQVKVFGHLRSEEEQCAGCLPRAILDTKVEVIRNVPEEIKWNGNVFITDVEVDESKVDLWWPNGLGEQPLYTLKVSFCKPVIADNKVMYGKEIRVGFRKIELIEENATNIFDPETSAAKGLTFYFKVNDEPIFMTGSNWIPAHVLPERGYDPDIVDGLLESARATNMRMLRVWGGGVYEDEHFYRRCDELGILVWQDFMFACSMYPATDHFLKSVKEEVTHNVLRLQHHPSIAIWAGNNENEVALRGNWYGTNPAYDRYKRDYIKLYVETIKPIVNHLDSMRRYLVSSPTNGIQSEREGYIAKNPYSPFYGDTHYYNYIANAWDPNIYPMTRFASEYGFQSLPSLATMRTATSHPEDFSVDSPYSIHRQHSPNGYTFMKMLLYTNLDLKTSDDDYFGKFIYYSQISQAMAIKVETERYRQSKVSWYTMGALYWQLNDVWQAPSWSGIEFGGRWKMLQYFAKHFFSTVLISSELTVSKHLDVYIHNDGLTDLQHLHWSVEKIGWKNLEVVEKVEDLISVNKSCVVKLPARIKIKDEEKQDVFFRLVLKDSKSGERVSVNHLFPEKTKYANLWEPHIKINVTKDDHHKKDGLKFKIHIETDRPILFMWLEADNLKGSFSDNGFIVSEKYFTVDFEAEQQTTPREIQKAITYRIYKNRANTTRRNNILSNEFPFLTFVTPIHINSGLF